MKKILIIEDEVHIADGIKLNLDFAGFECYCANDGLSGKELYKKIHPDLIVLDLMLPDIDGMDLLKNLRQTDSELPVLILSARGEVEDRKLGLTVGCDDYMTKPFDIEELELRIKRLLFRFENRTSNAGFVEFGDNKIDFLLRKAKAGDTEIHLTEQEVCLLKYLVKNSGKPVTRENMLTQALGYELDVQSRTIDNFIVRFRKYFEKNPKKPNFFKSIRSVGYLFDPNKKD